LARDERDVLPDHDLRLLVVEHEQVRRGQDVGRAVILQGANEKREIRDHAEARNRDRSANQAEVEPLPRVAEVDRGVDDVASGTARSEVGAAADVGVVRGGLQVLPLDAELRCTVGADFDDQSFDEHLRAPRVESFDDRANVVVNRLRRHDDQRVVGSVGLDRHAPGAE